jgi:hypothetical protein
MTRRAEPSEEELRSNIAKRMYIGPYPSHGTPSTSTIGKEPRQRARGLLPNPLARVNGVLGLKKGGKHNHISGGTGNGNTGGTNPATGSSEYRAEKYRL